MASTVVTTNSPLPQHKGLNKIVRAVFPMDFTGQTLAQNETWSLALLPVGTILHGACIEIVTAQATVTDVDLGTHATGATNAGLIDGVTLAAAGYVFTAGIAGPIVLEAAAYLVFTNKDAQSLTTAIINVIVDMSVPNWD